MKADICDILGSSWRTCADNSPKCEARIRAAQITNTRTGSPLIDELDMNILLINLHYNLRWASLNLKSVSMINMQYSQKRLKCKSLFQGFLCKLFSMLPRDWSKAKDYMNTSTISYTGSVCLNISTLLFSASTCNHQFIEELSLMLDLRWAHQFSS